MKRETVANRTVQNVKKNTASGKGEKEQEKIWTEVPSIIEVTCLLFNQFNLDALNYASIVVYYCALTK